MLWPNNHPHRVFQYAAGVSRLHDAATCHVDTDPRLADSGPAKRNNNNADADSGPARLLRGACGALREVSNDTTARVLRLVDATSPCVLPQA